MLTFAPLLSVERLDSSNHYQDLGPP